VQITKQQIGNQEAIVVDSVEHPPWAQQHLTSVEFDYDKKTISIVRYFVRVNPWRRQNIYSRWPIVIRDGVLPGEYALQVWRGARFEPIGRIIAAEKTIEYLPLKP
jgi:hypothetical protein